MGQICSSEKLTARQHPQKRSKPEAAGEISVEDKRQVLMVKGFSLNGNFARENEVQNHVIVVFQAFQTDP